MPLSRLRSPDSATSLGIATAAAVYLIYQNALPSLSDIHVAPSHDDTIEKTRKHAAWMSAALISVVFVVSRDLNSYVISGAALVGIDYLYKHNNAMNANTGKFDLPDVNVQHGDNVTAFPMPSYDDAAAE